MKRGLLSAPSAPWYPHGGRTARCAASLRRVRELRWRSKHSLYSNTFSVAGLAVEATAAFAGSRPLELAAATVQGRVSARAALTSGVWASLLSRPLLQVAVNGRPASSLAAAAVAGRGAVSFPPASCRAYGGGARSTGCGPRRSPSAEVDGLGGSVCAAWGVAARHRSAPAAGDAFRRWSSWRSRTGLIESNRLSAQRQSAMLEADGERASTAVRPDRSCRSKRASPSPQVSALSSGHECE